MHTARGRRRQGVGTAMLMHIIDAAHAMGLARLSLETGSAEYFVPARALYREAWFRGMPSVREYVVDPNSVFMTRT